MKSAMITERWTPLSSYRDTFSLYILFCSISLCYCLSFFCLLYLSLCLCLPLFSFSQQVKGVASQLGIKPFIIRGEELDAKGFGGIEVLRNS